MNIDKNIQNFTLSNRELFDTIAFFTFQSMVEYAVKYARDHEITTNRASEILVGATGEDFVLSTQGIVNSEPQEERTEKLFTLLMQDIQELEMSNKEIKEVLFAVIAELSRVEAAKDD